MFALTRSYFEYFDVKYIVEICRRAIGRPGSRHWVFRVRGVKLFSRKSCSHGRISLTGENKFSVFALVRNCTLTRTDRRTRTLFSFRISMFSFFLASTTDRGAVAFRHRIEYSSVSRKNRRINFSVQDNKSPGECRKFKKP